MNLSPNWRIDSWGYPVAKCKGKPVNLHKFIYSLIDPNYKGIVDHDDRNKLNSTRVNLRPATKAQNIQNQNLIGTPGVCWHKQAGKWQVYIAVENKRIFIGLFDSYTKAVEARRLAALEQHGKFAKER